MKKFVWTVSILMLMAGPALADAIYYAPQVTGKRERKNIRHFLFVKNLEGDKKAVYDEYGYTAFRHRLNEYGQIREQWTYYEHGKVFVFDQCSNLVDEQRIDVEKRRQWQYQRDLEGYDEAVCCDD